MPITDKIVYANVWEDPELNRLSLHVNENDDVLSVTSGGCNSLNLLVENPKSVVSMDLNKAQSALLELKCVGIKELSHEDFLELLGVEFETVPRKFHNDYRITLYKKIRKNLSEWARDFFDNNEGLIYEGLIMSGKVEHFFRIYKKILDFLYKSDPIQKIFYCPDLEIQRKVYNSINFKKWHMLNWSFLNRRVLSMVKGAHSFKFVEEKEFDKNLNRKIDHTMRNVYNRDNYFFQLILLGRFLTPDSVPPYLKSENFDNLKKNIDKLRVYQGITTDILKDYGKESFSKFSMSNIFEWMEDDIFNGVIREIIDIAKENSRLCYRYTLAKPRKLDEENSKILIDEPELAKKLHDKDRSFMYESFHVYEIKK